MENITIKMFGLGAIALFVFIAVLPTTSAAIGGPLCTTKKIYFTDLGALFDYVQQLEEDPLIDVIEFRVDRLENGWLLTITYCESILAPQTEITSISLQDTLDVLSKVEPRI